MPLFYMKISKICGGGEVVVDIMVTDYLLNTH